jgi:hypothetical protein
MNQPAVSVSTPSRASALLHLVDGRHADAALPPGHQIAKADSLDATAARRVTGSSTASSSWPRRRFWTKPCPAITMLVLGSWLRPCIGPSRAFGRRWSPSMRLVASRSVPGRLERVVHHRQLGRGWIGDDLDRCDLGCPDGPFDEAVGSGCVPSCGQEHVDDLAELVDRPIDVASPSGDLDRGRIDLPAVADTMAAGPAARPAAAWIAGPSGRP